MEVFEFAERCVKSMEAAGKKDSIFDDSLILVFTFCAMYRKHDVIEESIRAHAIFDNCFRGDLPRISKYTFFLRNAIIAL